MKKHLLALILSSAAFTASVSAQSYTEGVDLPGTGTGPNFIMMGASMTISGMLNTPGDGQDRFQITIPAGCQITGASWTMTDTANINVNGFAQFGWNNQEPIPPLNGTFANGPFAPFPVPSGTHDCMMNANIAANDYWSITFYSDCPLGITGVNFADGVTVTANPFADKIQLQNTQGDENYSLFNFTGQIVWSGRNIQDEDLSALSPGVYLLRVEGERSQIIKLVKE